MRSLVALCLVGCLDVAEDRALGELDIGVAADDELRLRVEGGLATVRSLNQEELHLWAQAPVLSIEIEAEAPLERRLRIENVLFDAALSASGAAIELESEAPKTKIWRLRIPAAGTVRLRLAPPDAASIDGWRFGLFADVQERIDDVGDIYRRMNEDPLIRFVVISGDLTEDGSREQLELFREKLSELSVPCFATLGNHELGSDDALFHELYGRGSFSFTFRGVRFTLLDSASATLAPTAYGWLEEWLELGRDDLHVVAMHIPPLDPIGLRNGAFANRGEGKKLVSLLAEGGVDLTLYGHVHSYYAFSNGGIPAFISGGGGAIPERLDGIERHYLAIDVDPSAATFQTALVRVD